jgi:very-short-patch-repair endonuclease
MLVVLLGGVAAVIVAAALLLGFLTKGAPQSPYRKQEYLLTTGERSFFGVLSQAISDDMYVFAKVRLSDLLRVSQGAKDWRVHQNKIQSKHIDFVLCDKATTETRLLIELDDSSHQRANRQSRDAFLDEALRGAGLPILHVTARRCYPVAELRQQVLSLLSESAPVAESVAAEEGAKG